MTEQPLYCPLCKQPTSILNTDDIGTTFYKCVSGHRTIKAITQQKMDEEKHRKSLINASRIQAEQNGENKKKSQADRLIEYCLDSNVELFLDQHGIPYARIKITCDNCDTSINQSDISQTCRDEKTEDTPDRLIGIPQVSQVPQFKNVNYPIDSSFFKQYLANLMWEREEKAPSNEALISAKNVLKGKTQSEGKRYTLFNRIAPDANGIWIDMADNYWRAIYITPQGWEIVNDPPILFKRYAHQLPLIIPEKEGDAWQLLNLLNLKENDKETRLAVLTTIISYLIPLIAHPAISVDGPQGAAKSWFLKLIKMLFDPSSIELLTLGKDERELAQELEHHWIAPFDNLSYLENWASDMLCRAITGAGISVRKLYTDDEDIILSFKHCVLTNGINIVAHKGDLLNRAILVSLDAISNEKRRTEKELTIAFNKLAPFILGGCLNTLAKALTLYPSINCELQRLADFSQYGCAIALALGKTQKEFEEAYANKVERQNDETINADPVASAFLKYCYNEVRGQKIVSLTENIDNCVELEPTELYKKVTFYAAQSGTDTKGKEWPRSANHFSRKLNLSIPALRSKGIILINYNGTPRKVRIIVETPEPNPENPSIEQSQLIVKTDESGLRHIEVKDGFVTKERLETAYNQILEKFREFEGPVPIAEIDDKDALTTLLREGRVFNSNLPDHIGVA